MMEYHISKEVRHKIFHELAARFQRSVFDVLSPWWVPFVYYLSVAVEQH